MRPQKKRRTLMPPRYGRANPANITLVAAALCAAMHNNRSRVFLTHATFPKKSYPPLPSFLWRGDEGILQTNLVWNWARRAYSSTRPKGGGEDGLHAPGKMVFWGWRRGGKSGGGGEGECRRRMRRQRFNGNGGGRRGARESTQKMKRALENVSRSQETKGGVPL